MEHPDCGAEEREQKEDVGGCLGRLTMRNREAPSVQTWAPG